MQTTIIDEKKFFEVKGRNKFVGIIGVSKAKTAKEAIKNVAYKRGLIQSDEYSDFRSTAQARELSDEEVLELFVVQENECLKNKYYKNFAQWMERRND